MAGKQIVGWPGVPPHHYYNLRAEPLSWTQRLPWFPFFKDTKPKFRLTVSCVQANVPSQSLRWFIMFENGTETGHDLVVPPMTQGESRQYTIGDRLLGFGGDTILGVKMPSGGFHTLVSFWTLRGEMVMYGAVLALLSGIAGALIAFLIN